MSLLFIGGGARETAIAHHISERYPDLDLYFAPGDAQTESLGLNLPLKVPGTFAPQSEWDHYFDELHRLARSIGIDEIYVFPEDALAHGVVDYLQTRGMWVFGPTKKAAQLEASKELGKQILGDLGINTASYQAIHDLVSVHRYLDSNPPYPVVVKANGLWAGKGVTIARNSQQVLNAASEIFAKGDYLLLEEFLEGWEVSAFAFVGRREDGRAVIVPWGLAQDYKALYPGGPNTGGIGAYSPVPSVTPDIFKQIWKIMRRVTQEMVNRGTPFTGVLFLGAVVVSGVVYVLEFNCRPGDPETQVLIARLKGDFRKLALGCVNGGLEKMHLTLDDRKAVGVVMCSSGYPGEYKTGLPIIGLNDHLSDTFVFQAGTRLDGEKVVTSGGRVLTVVGLGEDFAQARKFAYERVKRIHFQGRYYREDLAQSL